MRRYRWGARAATAVVVGAATLGVGATSWAASASFLCRLAIAKASTKVAKTGYSDASACRKAADKASQATGPCDAPGSAGFDPKGKYSDAKTKGTGAIGAKCLSGDPVLDNY